MVVDTYNIGTYTSDLEANVLKASALSISELVDIATYKQMEFTDAVNLKNSTVLDVHRYFRKNRPVGAFRINEQAHSPYVRFETFEKNMSLKKYRAGVEIDDEAKIRLDQANQLDNSIRLAGESFAELRDQEILMNLLNGAAISEDASQKWNSANSDITGDLGGLLDTLFAKDTTNVTESEINSIVIYYPLKLYSQIREPAKFFDASTANLLASRIQVNTTDLDWARNTYGITWVGSRKLNYVGSAVAVIRSEQTADHYTLSNNAIPQTETGRNIEHGIDQWITTRYFGTFVYPNSSTELNKNDRIMLINKVCDQSIPTEV